MYPALAVYYFILLSITILGIARRRYFLLPDKLIAGLMAFTILDELVALAAKTYYHNNLVVYHIYSPLEFFLISLYFNYSITLFRRKRIGIITGIAGLLLSLCNTLFIQKITSINSYFLLFEGMTVIIFCLFSFHQILMDEEHLPYRFAHFWITICFLIYWSTTFTGWGIYTVLDEERSPFGLMFTKVLAGANYVFYLGIGAVFLRYKKLIPSGA